MRTSSETARPPGISSNYTEQLKGMSYQLGPDKMWSAGERNAKPLQHSCLESPMNSMKRQKVMTLKDETPLRLVDTQYATGVERSNSSERMKRLSQRGNSALLWQYLVVKVKFDAVKNNVTWNVRSKNQGKKGVVKQEMARVNINILGISELKCIGMGEFNSDDHYIYYCA